MVQRMGRCRSAAFSDRGDEVQRNALGRFPVQAGDGSPDRDFGPARSVNSWRVPGRSGDRMSMIRGDTVGVRGQCQTTGPRSSGPESWAWADQTLNEPFRAGTSKIPFRSVLTRQGDREPAKLVRDRCSPRRSPSRQGGPRPGPRIAVVPSRRRLSPRTRAESPPGVRQSRRPARAGYHRDHRHRRRC